MKLAILPVALLLILITISLYHQLKPLPEGLSFAAPKRQAESVRLLFDATWVDAEGKRHQEQQIFDHIFELIGQAERLILLDMFLINRFAGDSDQHRPLGRELVAALLAQKARHPGIKIQLITDPFNTLYGAVKNDYLAKLKSNGVEVLETPLRPLRDPNPLWSSVWRLCCQWFGNSGDGGWLPNPVGTQPVTLRTYLTLLNFKANHRKTLIVDSGDGWKWLVTSGNPHDASSAHDNTALVFSGAAVADLLQSEMAVLKMAGVDTSAFPMPVAVVNASSGNKADHNAHLQVLTEGAIRDRLLAMLGKAGEGDRILLQMFYFSHREVLKALQAAQHRGAHIQVLIDPSEAAFGRKKNGVPNRQVAADLVASGVDVRWCDTHGEQCHSKLLLIDRADGSSELLLGSANYTRRNLDNYNLETSVLLTAVADYPAIRGSRNLFYRQWRNEKGALFSAEYSMYQDDSRWRYMLYRFMEWSGLSTF